VMRSMLNDALPRGYVADIGERAYVEQRGQSIYPDLTVFEERSKVREGRSSNAAVADPPVIVQVEDDEIREVFVRILPVGDEERVVTIIEVLSPKNKERGPGRTLYLQKQQEILNSETHLLEIDFLRAGAHTIGLPEEVLHRRGKKTYTVCLHRANRPSRYEYWPIEIREPLPKVTVPLLDGDLDVVLDLQRAFERSYLEGAYERRIDYRNPPTIPLTGEQVAWCKSLLAPGK
jgi:hypothetical protein